MRLYLIRHGAVVPPKPGAIYGGADVPLSDVGKNEARAAGAALAAVALDHIIASPLARASYGATQVVAGRDLEIEHDDGLREIDRGRWYGLTVDEIDSRFPGDLAAHGEDPVGWRDHGGESLADLQRRVLAVRDRLLRRFRGQRVALVSHMMPTRALLADAKGLDYAGWRGLDIPTASISMIDFDRGNGRGRVGWVGYKPDGLSVTQAFPHYHTR